MTPSNGGGAATAASPRRTKASANGAGKKSGAAKAATAVAEVTPDAVEQKVADFRGLKIVLLELPKTFMWDFAAANTDVRGLYQLAQSLIKPEQLGEVRGLLADYPGDPDDFMNELLSAVFKEHGLGVGESEASQDS